MKSGLTVTAISADAGFFTDVQVTTNALADSGGLEVVGAYGGACISDWSSSFGFMAIYPVPCSQTNNSNWLVASNAAEGNVQWNLGTGGVNYYKQAGSQYASWSNLGLNITSGAIYDNTGATSGFSSIVVNGTMLADAGTIGAMQIGVLGTVLTNVSSGSCTLAAGTCNALISGGGVTGNSLCSCQMINPAGSYYDTDAGGFTCMTTPDAGAVTPFPEPIKVGIHCDN
jgi:hypothetical protein